MNEQSDALPPSLMIRGLGKNYGPVTALEPTDLTVTTGEFLTLLGPSGSGKTTLLQMIAGLTEPTSGTLIVDGRDETLTPVHLREMGMVFQHYALFPHMTVSENVAFPLKMRGVAGPEIAARVRETLEKVRLESFAERFPRELSGGQQQRVALARCFVYRPKIILMDEPLGALDKNLREAMQLEIKRLHREFGTTLVYVTHDQEEALVLSDRICLMNQARVEQIGTPQQIYTRPTTAFSARFIGLSTLLAGRIAVADGTPSLVTEVGRFVLGEVGRFGDGEAASLVLRPERLVAGPAAEAQDNKVRGVVTDIVYVGSDTRLLVRLPDETVLTVRLTGGTDVPDAGAELTVGWDRETGVLVG